MILAMRRALLGCAGFCLLVAVRAEGQCPGQLQDRADVVSNPPGNDYDVYFTDDDPSDSDFFSAASAGFWRDGVANSHDVLVSPTHAFDNPFFSRSPNDSCVYDDDPDVMASAPESEIIVQSTNMRGESEIIVRGVAAHELFHHTQYNYIDFDEWQSWGAWLVEGTSKVMEDKLFDDIDQNPTSRYLDRVDEYLGNPNETLSDASYKTALFWSYFMEQAGAEPSEPGRGVDAMRAFWEQAAGESPDTFRILRNALQALGSDSSLEDLMTRFAISMYTHDRDLSRLPDARRYSYFDESAAGGGTRYATIGATTAAPNTNLSDSVNRWAARHFQSTIGDVKACSAVGVKAVARDGKSLGFGLVGTKSSNRVTDVYPGRGNTYYRALISAPRDPYTQLGLAVAGLSEGATFDYSFGSGPIAGSVRLPSEARQALVGAIGTPPQRFLLRLLLTGPAVLTPEGASGPASIKGLDPTLFTITLRSSSTGAGYAASIVNAMYVDGEYWLTILPPSVSAADGVLYDLAVCFCNLGTSCGGQELVSAKSVLYETEILHQVLTVDRSNSMHYPEPAETAKITAARNAARMYVDSAQDDDQLGLVSFLGNNAECDDDAELRSGLVPVVSSRDALNDEIDNISEAGWTSIGDGLKKARNAVLAGTGSIADVRGIVLMSDGLENEADYWARPTPACGSPAVRDSFDPALGGVAGDVRIDTVAFGADADQPLLQSIADFSNGLALAVSADAPAGGSGGPGDAPGDGRAPAPRDLEVANRLASAYRAIEEDTRDQDRLFFTADQLEGGIPLELIIPVTEHTGGGVQQGTFAFNWHRDKVYVDVELRDPAGNLIVPNGVWDVSRDATNTVYRYAKVLPPGNYTATLIATDRVQIISMLSGRLLRGVALDTRLSQVRRAAPNRECYGAVYKYLRGLPVTVLANLSDARGPIDRARVEAEVSNPDGTSNRIVLFDDGAHDDSLANDGIFGNVYTRTPFSSNAGVRDFPAGPPSGAWGSYAVDVHAEGVSGYGDSFRRDEQRTFHVFEFSPTANKGCDPDLDKDGLPDRWELLYGLNPADPTDAALDHDQDGLDARAELKLGTLPRDADSDDGGESDGSEAKAGRDPLYTNDDALPALMDYGVVTHTFHRAVQLPRPKANLLHFSVSPSYRYVHVFRTDPSWSGYKRVASLDAQKAPRGVYYDKGLSVGFTYAYYLVAEGLSAAITPRTPTFVGTPKTEPVPPVLALAIDNGAQVVGSRNVLLRLVASPDTKHMMISSNARFTGASWQVYKEESPYVLPAGGPGRYRSMVFAKLRDAAGNVSFSDVRSVLVDENGDADGDGMPNWLDPDDDGDGLLDADELRRTRTDPLLLDSDRNGIKDPDEDTDHDGISDEKEVNAIGTDPRNPDSDGDGIPDGKEVDKGSDPLDPLDPGP